MGKLAPGQIFDVDRSSQMGGLFSMILPLPGRHGLALRGC